MNSSRRKAIAVDDDEHVLAYIVHLMELLEFDVKGFLCPVKALDYLKTHRAEIILTDFKMPTMDGMQFVREIRRIDEGVPIIMITGEADNPLFPQLFAEMALSSGIAAILRKPIDIALLEKEIKRLLESSSGDTSTKEL